MLSGAGISNVVVLAVFLPIIICLCLYAPADTKAWPLIGNKLRMRMKKKAVICGLSLMVVTLMIPGEATKLLLTIGAGYQSIAILPLAYKILKRSEKNYEKYEKLKRG
jgi:accessory gene regulator B